VGNVEKAERAHSGDIVLGAIHQDDSWAPDEAIDHETSGRPEREARLRNRNDVKWVRREPRRLGRREVSGFLEGDLGSGIRRIHIVARNREGLEGGIGGIGCVNELISDDYLKRNVTPSQSKHLQNNQLDDLRRWTIDS